MRKRSNYPKEFKARVAMEALKEEKTLAQISSEYEVHSNGVVKMMKYMRREGYAIGYKLVKRLMRSMSLTAIYPKPNLSKRHPEHKIYPYLLRGVVVIRANQVWATDITYIQ